MTTDDNLPTFLSCDFCCYKMLKYLYKSQFTIQILFSSILWCFVVVVIHKLKSFSSSRDDTTKKRDFLILINFNITKLRIWDNTTKKLLGLNSIQIANEHRTMIFYGCDFSIVNFVSFSTTKNSNIKGFHC